MCCTGTFYPHSSSSEQLAGHLSPLASPAPVGSRRPFGGQNLELELGARGGLQDSWAILGVLGAMTGLPVPLLYHTTHSTILPNTQCTLNTMD